MAEVDGGYTGEPKSVETSPLGLAGRLMPAGLLKEIAATFSTRVTLIAVGLITSVLVTRALHPEGRGLFAAAATVTALGVQFGNLGLHASNTYAVAGDRRLLPSLVGNSLVVSLVAGGGGALALTVVFARWPAIAPVQGILLALALIGIPIGLAYLLFQNLLIGINRVGAYNALELGGKLAAMALIGAIVIVNSVTVEALFAAGMLATVGTTIWAVLMLRREFDAPMSAEPRLLQEHARYGIKAYVAALFAFLVIRVDILLIQYILGPEATGLYAVAVTLADMVYLLPVVAGTLLFPRLVRMSQAERLPATRRAALLIGGATAAIAIVAAILAAPAIRILYGVEFVPAVWPFVWLLPAIVLMAVNTIYMNYFASIGMPMVVVYSPAVAFVVNTALNLVLLPRLGIVGASISSIAAYGLMLVATTVYIRRSRATGNVRDVAAQS